jgi:regulator of Ty1 transposition protein 103
VLCTDRSAADRLAKTVEEACSLLANYNARLADELQERRRIARLLREFILLQKTLLAEDEKKVEVRSLHALMTLSSQGTKI